MEMMLQTQNLCKYFRKQKAVIMFHLISKGTDLWTAWTEWRW